MLQGNPLISNIAPAKTHEKHRDEPLSSAEHSTPLSLGEGLGVRLLERGWGVRLFFYHFLNNSKPNLQPKTRLPLPLLVKRPTENIRVVKP